MASITFPARAIPIPTTATVPWYAWLAAASVSSAVIGTEWDISWHRSIGRDSFLTPAHIAIYMCGILAGVVCSYLIFSTTFGRNPLSASSVHVWGFQGPLGAFVASWGGVVMLTSAPFDDWWHSAYGLDVKILSPPHVMLAIGILTVAAGSLLLLAGQKNRTPGAAIDVLFLYVGALIMTALIVVMMDYTYVTEQHSGIFYRVQSMFVPGMFALLARGSGRRWAATTAVAFYTAIQLGLLWILPLFSATPKLGPVFHPVTHFVPPEFPILLIVPAIVLDSFWHITQDWKWWTRASVSAVLFVGVLIAAQWPFAQFLESPLARNPVFGMEYFDYQTRPTTRYFQHLFTPMEKTAAEFWLEMIGALFAAFLTTSIGFRAGNWLRAVRR